MKVRIGSREYDSNKVPIILELTEQDKELISNMGEQKIYCTFPLGIGISDIKAFIDKHKGKK